MCILSIFKRRPEIGIFTESAQKVIKDFNDVIDSGYKQDKIMAASFSIRILQRELNRCEYGISLYLKDSVIRKQYDNSVELSKILDTLMQYMISDAVNVPTLKNNEGSYILIELETGKAVCEFFKGDSTLKFLDFNKYKLISITEHLANLNKK